MGAEGLTYNERRGQGYGTVKERLGKVKLAGILLSNNHINGRVCLLPGRTI